MFAGIVEQLGTVARIVDRPPGIELVIEGERLAGGAQIGDSVAINGCCLTVVRVDSTRLSFEAGAETLGRTNLGQLAAGSVVNLERSLVIGDRLGGHFVTGHIDTVGTLHQRIDEGDWSTCWFSLPQRWTRQMASKGSVAVDGVSLTLVDVLSDRFSVALIPHTLSVTTLGRYRTGEAVNIETDVLAKYVQRQLEGDGSDATNDSSLRNPRETK